MSGLHEPAVLPSGPPGHAAFIPAAAPFDLHRTLVSGQCFRWTITPDGARGVVDGSVPVVRQREGGLDVAWCGPPRATEHLMWHLGADQPLAAIEGALARDRVLRHLLARTSGIAVMRQDPWECLISFVISAFNNIPKIQMSIRALARCFGERIAPGVDEWSFPTPERLAEASDAALGGCVLGYRARYVRAVARFVADREIELPVVATLSFDDARNALLALPGVGEKVADCVLLFGLGRREAFPVDVWVQRAVERWYFQGRTKAPSTIRAWARDRFGTLAGHAQQHLFAAVRADGRR